MKSTMTNDGLTVTLDCDNSQWSNAETALVAETLNEDKWVSKAWQAADELPADIATGKIAVMLSECFDVTGANYKEIAASLIGMAINAR